MVEDLVGIGRWVHGGKGVLAGAAAATSGRIAYHNLAERAPKIDSQINTDLTEIYIAMYGHAPKSAADLELFRNIVGQAVGRNANLNSEYEKIGFDVNKYEQAALKTGNARIVEHPPEKGISVDESGAPTNIEIPVPAEVMTTPEELMVELTQAHTFGVASLVGVVVLGITSWRYLAQTKRGWHP